MSFFILLITWFIVCNYFPLEIKDLTQKMTKFGREF